MNITVTSAIALDAKQKETLEGVLQKKISEKYSLEFVVNPQILGGLKVTIGSKRIDLSLAGKLSQIAKAL